MFLTSGLELRCRSRDHTSVTPRLVASSSSSSYATVFEGQAPPSSRRSASSAAALLLRVGSWRRERHGVPLTMSAIHCHQSGSPVWRHRSGQPLCTPSHRMRRMRGVAFFFFSFFFLSFILKLDVVADVVADALMTSSDSFT